MGYKHEKNVFLKPDPMKDGYLRVTLLKDGILTKVPVHILVAKAFLSNPTNFDKVNHKDENKSNNIWTNLEWCDSQYNLEYSLSRYYIAIDPVGKEYEVFNLSAFCREYKLSLSAMSEMATGRIAKNKKSPRLSHKGWTCSYLTGNPIRGVNKHAC